MLLTPRPRRRPLRLLVGPLLALLLLVTACGDDDADTATDGSSQPDAPTGEEAGDGAVDGGEATFAGVRRDPAPSVAEASLPEVVDPASGATEDFPFVAPADDGILLVYFGYTSCPDVCPTTMADVKTALAQLGPDAERISTAMVTVDPERDTGEVLDGYVRFFVPENSHILRTEDFDQLHAVEDVFGARSDLVPKEDGEGYDVEHTGTLYAVDGDGVLVAEWPFGAVKGDDIASDLRQILDGEA